ncbi:MAG: GNAT family N-acetyltransferase [Ignavibacteriales bacterium]|nr:GNAT family N-acetyltransferase [Ignavibacteriales bacterium]
MTTTLRMAQQTDTETIARFNVALAKETEHFDLDFERTLRGVNAMFDDAARGFYLLAEVNGQIVGQLMITYEWSDWRNGVFWWIQSVYVKEEFRARKIFKSLYEHVVTLAKKEGNVCGLRLYAEKQNERAHAVYKKLGMKVTEYDMLEVDFVLKR